MANKVDLGCPQLRGNFVLSGKVTGRYSNSFYSEGTSSNGNSWRRVHFGVEIEHDKFVYVDLFGSVQENVYFSKTVRGADGKNNTETRSVRWGERMKPAKTLFGDDKFRIIGVTCGCRKTHDKNGKEINDKKYLTAYDACEEVQYLTDGDSVYIRGNITYSEYNNQHTVRFEPTQISLMTTPVDLDQLDYQANARFTQPIVCMDVAGNSETLGEYVVTAKIVNYQTVEDTEFYTRNKGLAKNLKGLGAYTHIKVWGDIEVQGEVQEVKESADGWGTSNRMDRIESPFKRKLMITGADPETIDHERYSESVIEHAMVIANGIRDAKNDYGKKDDSYKAGGWGSGAKSVGDDFDDDELEMDLGI